MISSSCLRHVTRRVSLQSVSIRLCLPLTTSHRLTPNTSAARWLSSSSPPPPVSPDTETSSSSSSSSNANLKKNDKKSTTELELNLRPSEVVAGLDRHIVGQQDAKRAVAIAMRNRWRRKQLPDALRKEVTPRNVLLVGPTGCGKTEVARRMAMLNDAPFIKVEATKFTEVGYHGRDVDQIIRDLMDVSMQLTRKVWTEKLRGQAKAMVEDRILDLLTGPAQTIQFASSTAATSGDSQQQYQQQQQQRGRESFRDMLRQGILDDQEIEVEVPMGDRNQDVVGGDGSNPNVAAMTDLWQKLSGAGGGKKHSVERKKLPISEAKDVILEVELDKLLENVDLKKRSHCGRGRKWYRIY
jgi:ATP-dependent HslUV protease ATP-binding subunit HslU